LKNFSRFALLTLIASLTACSVLESDKIDYKSAAKAPTLEVPPDLTQLSRDNRYAVPGGAVSANSYQAGKADAPSIPTAAATLGDVRMERSGNQRWLVVNRPADQLWEPVRDFWQESGFLLTTDQRNLGIMETDWAENRAKLPQDIIRGTLGKVFDSLYSTGELDRYRTRLERTTTGTEIYISHRGMEELYTTREPTGDTPGQTAWQPRAPDPELEAEFLRRLMVRLGAKEERAKQLLASATPQQRADIVKSNDGTERLQVHEPFDRAWRRVGLALDRVGFTVEDRDRQKGLYFVRYADPEAEMGEKEKGLFGRISDWFSNDSKVKAAQYRVQVTSETNSSQVYVLNKDGTAERSKTAQRILTLLHEQLK
jgi:outer membrane protein assembly factor BamC